MRRAILIAMLLLFAGIETAPLAAQGRAEPGDADQTLRAMRDEMERSRERLRLGDLQRPFYIEYRLLDVDVRAVTASFGAILTSRTSRNRLMNVDVRVGDYLLDSSNFIADDAFRGFLGSSGQVGIDRDYESLRQDLWLSTDQAYKEALDRLSRKQAYIANLARKPDIPDFSREKPVVMIQPLAEPDWTSRNWEEEARAASAEFRQFPAFYSSRTTYYLVYLTYYLLNSEGTQIRVTRSVAAIEAGANTQSEDGMRLNHFYSAYAIHPKDLPPVNTVREEIRRTGEELMALRHSSPAEDYSGPVLLEPPAAASLLAQILPPSISGARPPLSMMAYYEQMMERLGGRSEWTGRLNSSVRVLPAGVDVWDDPTAREFNGQPLLGSYEVDEEGVAAQKVSLVEDGNLKNLLMTRRPGPDLTGSNGHARAVFLGEPRPAHSNLFFSAKIGLPPAEMKKRFLELCKAEGREWCVVVKKLDNPAIGAQSQEDFSDFFAGFAGGAASGDRAPLLVYKVYVNGGREELIRGGRLTGLTLRSLRRIAAIGSDATPFSYFQNPGPGFAGTSLGAFGSAQGGIPSTVVAPSLLLEEAEMRGARGEPRRPPILPAPPLQ
jgi:predicted Zn-dependent protease